MLDWDLTLFCFTVGTRVLLKFTILILVGFKSSSLTNCVGLAAVDKNEVSADVLLGLDLIPSFIVVAVVPYCFLLYQKTHHNYH